MTDGLDALLGILLWTIVLCAVFGAAAYISDRIEETNR